MHIFSFSRSHPSVINTSILFYALISTTFSETNVLSFLCSYLYIYNLICYHPVKSSCTTEKNLLKAERQIQAKNISILHMCFFYISYFVLLLSIPCKSLWQWITSCFFMHHLTLSLFEDSLIIRFARVIHDLLILFCSANNCT